MTPQRWRPGVGVRRAICCGPACLEVSDAVTALLQKAADASASNTLELCESLQKKEEFHTRNRTFVGLGHRLELPRPPLYKYNNLGCA